MMRTSFTAVLISFVLTASSIAQLRVTQLTTDIPPDGRSAGEQTVPRRAVFPDTEARIVPVQALAPTAAAAPNPNAGLAPAAQSHTVAGLRHPLPALPLQERRPDQTPAAPWDTTRRGAEREPLSDFLGSVKGNDAVLEVIVGQGRLLSLKKDIAGPQGAAVIAVGDPTIVDFEVLPNPRLIRVFGSRAGVTDLSITTADGNAYNFEIHIIYDLELLETQLRQLFPDAYLKVSQLREHLVIEGQARTPAQASQILQTTRAFLMSVQVPYEVRGEEKEQPERPERQRTPPAEGEEPPPEETPEAEPSPGDRPTTKASFAEPQIINLIRVPGVNQVMLQVRIAELNRTAAREIGADIIGSNAAGQIIGTNIGGGTISAMGMFGLGGLASGATGALNPQNNTAIGICPGGDFEVLLRALRRNSVVSVLAEPNLVTMSGHQASFLAGGEFPVPVPQGVSNAITIEYKPFGVQLQFLPFVLDDETIRMSVTPEVSRIDEQLGTSLFPGGEPVPALTSRRATTTVELKQGQTLAIAGLLQLDVAGQTSRIPLLGDLPYVGPLFSSTQHASEERELLVLVTPFLVHPMDPEQVPPLPGTEITEPNDLEFYLLNRIEGRTCREFRSTTAWDDPLGLVELLKLEAGCMCGSVGLSDYSGSGPVIHQSN